MNRVLPIVVVLLVILIVVGLSWWSLHDAPTALMVSQQDLTLEMERGERDGSAAATQVAGSVDSAPTKTGKTNPTATAVKLDPAPESPTATPTERIMPSSTPAATATPIATATWVPPTPLPVSALTLTPPSSGRFLLVDQDEQRMYVYEDAVLVRQIPVSTGAPLADKFTPAWRGEVGDFWGRAAFRNTNLWADYIWYLFPGSEGSILIHSVPYTRDGDDKVYDRLEALGVEPASAGCIRISPNDAEWLAAWNPEGVEIEITPLLLEIGPPDDSL